MGRYAATFILAGAVTCVVRWLAVGSSARGQLVAGLLLMFPTLTLLSLTAAYLESRDAGRPATIARGGLGGLIPLGLFLGMVWLLSPRIGYWRATGASLTVWLLAAIAVDRALGAK